jgi:RNA methyltransferase, TrmH family
MLNSDLTKITRYKKGCGYSYSLGIFPTIELLKHKSEKVIKVFLGANSKDSQGIDLIKNLCEKNGIVYEKNEKMLRILSPKENTYAIGVFITYEKNVQSDKNAVLLVNPSTSGNVGTIIRTMVGFGIYNLQIVEPAVDIFNPEAIRASMGAIFAINFEYYKEVSTALHSSKNIYMFCLKGKNSLAETKIISPYTLVFGNEGAGLSDNALNTISQSSKVSIPSTSEVDSYNLAVSAGIAMYESYKQNPDTL